MERIETGIYRRPDGRLHVHTTAKDPYTGEMRHKRQTLDEGATVAAAKKVRAQLKHQVTSAKRPRGPSVHTVEEYAIFWTRQKVPKKKPSTRTMYVSSIDRVCAFLGSLEVRDVVRADIGNMVQHWEGLKKPGGAPYSTHTLRGWYRVAKLLFKDAVADGLLDDDPTERVEPPTTRVVAVRQHKTLSADELGRFVDGARVACPDRYAEIVTLAYTGMRAGELYGLSWDAVDFGGGRLTIRHAVSRRQLMNSTKTSAPRETVMPDIVAEALRAHQIAQDPPSALVFPASNGKPRGADTLRKPLAAALKASEQIPLRHIEIKVGPQVLRRTFNTLLIAAGVDRIVQRSMMGHTTEQVTERYAGVRHEDKTAAVLRLIEGGKG